MLKHTKQDGAALVVGLVMLAILTFLGVYAVKNSSMQEITAANVHQSNWVFNAADAGVGAFTEMANAGNDVGDPTHILYRARVNGNVNFCVDADGDEAGCNDTYIDNKAAQVQVNVEKKGCVQQLCFGYSLGSDKGGVKCLVYEVDSTGTGMGMTEQVEWWAYQISAQC
ncbi:MAG: pilus assembly PilX N-terminal domain-containing protein [Gammaproteobacteria bacterium]|nr:pilus assembly PilX N-terminal domain-containing protein [Gammaproteobacteria bacterium]